MGDKKPLLSHAGTLLDAVDEIKKCVHCGYCLEFCPTRDAGVFDIYGARGKMLVFKSIVENESLEIVDEVFGDRVLNCALCNWCTSKCPESIPLTDLFVLARYEAAKRGLLPKSVKRVADYVISRGNPFGAAGWERVEWARGLDLKEGGETVFFASCMGSTMGYLELIERTRLSLNRILDLFEVLEKLKLDGTTRYVVQKMVRPNKGYNQTLRKCVNLLKSLGIEVSYLYEDEPCCGKPLHTYGLLDEFKEHVRNVVGLFKSRRIRRVITNNPICLYTFKKLYPLFVENFDIEVKHMVEILYEKRHMWLNTHKRGEGLRIVYHDPCYMSRYLSLTEEPRAVLEELCGAELVEPARAKEKSYCSGDGGIEVTHPGAARFIARKRAEMLTETGARVISTACPACVAMLRMGVRDFQGGRGVEVLDLVDLAYDSLIRRDRS